MFQVDLVHDAGIGRHHPEVTEGRLTPAQEAVALVIALELDLVVEIERVHLAKTVDLHGVIDHHFRRRQWIYLVCLATQGRHGIAHCCQVDDRRHAGKVLQKYPRGCKSNLGAGGCCWIPVAKCFDVTPGDVYAVFVAQ